MTTHNPFIVAMRPKLKDDLLQDLIVHPKTRRKINKLNEDLMNMRQIHMYDFNSRSTVRFIASHSIGYDFCRICPNIIIITSDYLNSGIVQACIDHDTKNNPSAAFDLTFMVEREFKDSDFDDIPGPVPEDIIDNRHHRGNFPVTFRFGKWSLSHVTVFLGWLNVHWPKLIPQLPISVRWFAPDAPLRKPEYTLPRHNSVACREGQVGDALIPCRFVVHTQRSAA